MRESKVMSTKNYTVSLVVDQSATEVFNAINDVRAWWTGEITGVTDQLGGEFSYAYKTYHRSTHRITELTPGRRVVWHTTDASINFVVDKSEWNGTDIVFEIARRGKQTALRFTHIGLVPTIECYGGCSGAWQSLITEGLYNLITQGKSQPVALDEPARTSVPGRRTQRTA
jgi:hypothetical protein